MNLYKQLIISWCVILLLYGGLNVVYGFDQIERRSGTHAVNQDQSDTTIIIQYLDSAHILLSENKYPKAIEYGEYALTISEQSAMHKLFVESSLFLARANFSINQQNGINNFATVLPYYLNAINVLETQRDSLQLPLVYIEVAEQFEKWQSLESALENYLKALNIIEPTNKIKERTYTLRKIAALSFDIENYHNSIYYYEKLLDLLKKYGTNPEIAVTYQILAHIYMSKKRDFDNALRYYKEAYLLFEKNEDTTRMLSSLSDIGVHSFDGGNMTQAIEYIDKYLELADFTYRDIQESPELSRYVQNIAIKGRVYELLSDNQRIDDYEYEKALEYYQKAFSINDQQKNPALSAKILNYIGYLYYKRKDYKSSVKNLDMAVDLGNQGGDLGTIGQSHHLLALNYEKLGKHKQALYHFEMHAAAKDSILSIELRDIRYQYLGNNRLQTKNLLLEKTEEMIRDQVMNDLELKRLKLQSEKREQEYALLQQEKELQDARLQNVLLEKEKEESELNVRLKTEERNRQIETLKREREKRESELREQDLKRQKNEDRIRFLEEKNQLARIKQNYYALSIVLISLIMFIILLGLIQKQKVNHKLRDHKEKIEHQADELKNAYQNLEILSNIGRDITSSLIIEQIIGIVYENVNTLMDASVFGIGIHDSTSRVLHFPGVKENGKTLKDIAIDETSRNSLASVCFKDQQEIIIEDYYKEWADYIELDQSPYRGDGNAASIIYLPLTINQRPLGVITVQSFETNAFNHYHVNIIKNIANYTKIALENASAYEEIAIKSENLRVANRKIQLKNQLIEEQNEQLININEEKNHLIGILAHDLRNPLSMAMSMTELVQYDRKKLNPEQHQASQIIWKALTRMNDMISKILDVKAIESQKLNIELEKVDLVDAFNRIKRHFADTSEKKNIYVNINIDSTEKGVLADGNYTMQVLENLVSNALKFSLPGSQIYLQLTDREDHLRIEVKDEGPGLTKRDLKKLFGKYQRLSAKPTGGEQSIGLGLSIVKKYVEMMNGKVWCESLPGKGASFFVDLPKATVTLNKY